jgi:hypothetical protein
MNEQLMHRRNTALHSSNILEQPSKNLVYSTLPLVQDASEDQVRRPDSQQKRSNTEKGTFLVKELAS